MRHRLIIEDACWNCNQTIYITPRQRIIHHELVWSMSYHCPSCNTRLEVDGLGFPPTSVRTALITCDGLWMLTIRERSPQLVHGMKQLRATLQLTVEQVKLLLAQVPGAIIGGTKTEMQYLAGLLTPYALVTAVEPYHGHAAVYMIPSNDTEA